MKKVLLALLLLMTPLLAQHPLVKKADMLCFQGRGIDAFGLYFVAAKAGDADAAFKSGYLLILMSERGTNEEVKRDMFEDAIKRMSYAEEKGHIQAAIYLDSLLNRDRSDESKRWMMEESICEDYKFDYKGYYNIIKNKFTGETITVTRKVVEEWREIRARHKGAK